MKILIILIVATSRDTSEKSEYSVAKKKLCVKLLC